MQVSGTDVINYPGIPTIERVSGCSQNGNATYDCPTAGGVRITIAGTVFKRPMSVLVSGVACTQIVLDSELKLSCVLAAAVGVDLPILLSSQGQFAQPVNLVSYKVPSLALIEGCTSESATSIIGACTWTR